MILVQYILKKIEIHLLHFMVYIIAIMNTTRITEIFKRVFLPHVKTPLGRWNNIHNHTETSLKMKYATEDNCGIHCYNNNNVDNHKIQKNDDNEYMYMMGYESVH
jgi:hypothetical protein